MIKLLSYMSLAMTVTLGVASARAAEPEPALELPMSEPEPQPEPQLAPPEVPTTTIVRPAPIVVAPEPSPAPRRFELAVTAEYNWLLSDSSVVTSEKSFTATPQIRVGWGPIDEVDVYLGWRAFTEIERDDRAWDLTTSGDAIVVGARGRLPIASWLAAVAELDLEALHVGVDLAIGGRVAATDDWTFGVIPKIGLEGRLDLGFADGVLRLEGGWAMRLPLAVDDVRLSSAAESVVPIDLGSLDLSGPVFALTLALRF